MAQYHKDESISVRREEATKHLALAEKWALAQELEYSAAGALAGAFAISDYGDAWNQRLMPDQLSERENQQLAPCSYCGEYDHTDDCPHRVIKPVRDNARVRVPLFGRPTIESIDGVLMEQCPHCFNVKPTGSFANLQEIEAWKQECASAIEELNKEARR
jgi:hypothetical protein